MILSHQYFRCWFCYIIFPTVNNLKHITSPHLCKFPASWFYFLKVFIRVNRLFQYFIETCQVWDLNPNPLSLAPRLLDHSDIIVNQNKEFLIFKLEYMYNDADVAKCLPALLVHCKEEKKKSSVTITTSFLNPLKNLCPLSQVCFYLHYYVITLCEYILLHRRSAHAHTDPP